MHRILASLLLIALAACAAKAPPAFFKNPFPLLLWMGEFTRPSGTVYPSIPDSTKFGGISGMAPDSSTQQWVAVIDDRDSSRMAWIDVKYDVAKGMDVTPIRLLDLRAGPGVPARTAVNADLEAVVALPNGTFLMSEEGHMVKEQIWQPAILQVSHDGVVTGVINYPPEFQITGDQKTGLRDNQGFEGLTITPGGRVIAGLEQPLYQDGIVTFDRGATSRLVEFVPSGSTYKPGRQWHYQISPAPRVENFDVVCGSGENGLVELLALSETNLISMERGCVTTKDGAFVANTVQLFAVELIGGDARKRLLMNFDTLSSRLSSALTRLENFEAMTFGPIVNGVPTLMIASDDNFRKTQKTSFLLLGMR